MGFLKPDDAAPLRARLDAEMGGPVTLEFFTRRSRLVVPGREPCPYCIQAEALFEELAGLSERLTLRVHDVDTDPAAVEAFGIFGVPAGLEFMPVVEAVIDASTGSGRPARQMSVEHDGIRAEMVEVNEFPEVARRYGVRGVPRIVVSDVAGFDGSRPERQFVALVARAAAAAAEREAPGGVEPERPTPETGDRRNGADPV